MRLSFGSLAVLFVCFFASPSIGSRAYAASPLPSNAAACEAQADHLLPSKLVTWQKRLGLVDWKLSVLVAPPGDLKPETLGNIHWNTDQKTAVIRVLQPAGYQTSCSAAIDDMQTTLVHELVHLELSSLPRSTDSRKDEEKAVNRITGALLQMDITPAIEADAATSAPGLATGSAARQTAPATPAPASAKSVPVKPGN